MKYSVEIALCGMLQVLNFVKTATGIQAILRFCFSDLRGCNVGITDGEGFMLYAVEVGSCAMIYKPIFIGIQKLLGGGGWINLLSFVQNMESRQKPHRLPPWSSGLSSWLQIQRSRFRFLALPDFLRSSGSGTGSTQPRKDNRGAT
jgi:hypothetical protein